jgi:hypothetical protein
MRHLIVLDHQLQSHVLVDCRYPQVQYLERPRLS